MAATHYKIMPLELATETKTYLQSLAISSHTGTIFLFKFPTSPVCCIALCPMGGPEDPVDVISHANLQVLVRDTHINTCAARAEIIWKELRKAVPRLGNICAQFTADHLPGFSYPDSNNYAVYSLNFTVTGLTRRA